MESDPGPDVEKSAATRSWTHWLPTVLAWAFGVIFIYSGWLKIFDPARFLVSIRKLHLLPDPFAAWMALSLPWLEIFAGIAVVSGWLRRGGLLLLNACLVIFAIALVSALVRGLDIECGCFGASQRGTSNAVHALWRDALLLVAGGWLWFLSRRRRETSKTV